ncbi:hypothetical protein TNCT_110371 [Trichonephila clavata]|uniref:Uncharacterized protein n=1 Tax=Trichonephila clavata TaxID=2740835 RepID=A0A8X6IFR2_TRICU|nr:hypothetical protein TNCT_110371 [Trichonephila clavata]
MEDRRGRRGNHPIHSFHLPGVWKWRTPSENSECGKDVILKGNEIFKIKATVEPPGAISSAELLRPGNRKTQAELLGVEGNHWCRPPSRPKELLLNLPLLSFGPDQYEKVWEGFVVI